jgi:hypothetical protein
MKRLTRAPNLAIATLWADMLSNAGIAATVQRMYASSIAGELPPDRRAGGVDHDDDELERAAPCSTSCAIRCSGTGFAAKATSASTGRSSSAGTAARRCRRCDPRQNVPGYAPPSARMFWPVM